MRAAVRRKAPFSLGPRSYDSDQIWRFVLVSTSRTFAREIPQGHAFTEYTAYGKRGNFFMDGTRTGGRDQALANAVDDGFGACGPRVLCGIASGVAGIGVVSGGTGVTDHHHRSRVSRGGGRR